ncbi:Golgi transport complex subunit 5-domain-containing protein [Zopfochytrium polystomum]|nr:Golgi transport complex subunit 5-domain-containing protein [Zopfochytrium polystomum]
MAKESVTATIGALLDHPDYREFARDDFDAAEYANSIMQGTDRHRVDTSSALSKLGFNIDHLNKQLRDQVATHYEDLLEQVTGLNNLDSTLKKVKEGVGALNTSFNRVKSNIREAYDQVEANTTQLERIQEAAEILRRVKRFLSLAKRVPSVFPESDEGVFSKTAITVQEIENLVSESDFGGIDVVEAEWSRIMLAKEAVVAGAERLLQKGMANQNQAEVASGLQIFHNLGQASQKVKRVIDAKFEVITKECKVSFDTTVLAREIKESSDRKTAGAAAGLWKRMEKLMDTIYDQTVQVYIFEKVVSRRRDPLTQMSFMDEVVKVLDSSMINYYWKNVSATFDRELRNGTKMSSHFQQILQVGYPKMLRLFQEFSSRLSTEIPPSSLPDTTALDSTTMLRSLTSFETVYLRESLSRLLDPINLAFPDKPLVGVRPQPSRDDVEKTLQAISREFEIAKFDPHLSKAVAKNVTKAVNMYAIRSEHMVATDAAAYQPLGIATASSSMLLNIEIVNCLWFFADGLWKMKDEFSETAIVSALTDAVDHVQKLIGTIIEPIMGHVVRDVESSILKIHKEDFGKTSTGKSPQRGQGGPQQESAVSTYVLEVGAKLRWTLREVMLRLQCGDDTKDWILSIAVRTLGFFVQQASLVRPLEGDAGKLRLTSDMTQLEFAMNQWVSGVGLKLTALGDAYKALRAFRLLPFLDLTQVTAPHHTASLPPLVVVHHLICRAHPAIPLPTALYNWSEAQYADWLDAHTEADAAVLLSRCLDTYVDDVRARGEKEFRLEYPVVRQLVAALAVAR